MQLFVLVSAGTLSYDVHEDYSEKPLAAHLSFFYKFLFGKRWHGAPDVDRRTLTLAL